MQRCAARFLKLILLAILLSLLGCISDPVIEENAPLLPGSTYLIHLPGVAGDSPLDRRWVNALENADAADHAVLYDWTCRRPGLEALEAHARNRAEAEKVAAMIVQQRKADPTGRVILTSESGGTAVAIWALEKLPPGVKVDQALLVAPALSPDYDLSVALTHVSKNVYYFDSPGDWFMLGFGTSTFGTMDGRNTNAAGLVGFHRPSSADAVQYYKLVEMRYDPAWTRWGDLGDHTGAMSIDFARHFIAPLILRGECESQATLSAARCARTSLAVTHVNP